MKIAVITVAYNRLSSLQRLLNSLAAADYCGDKVDLIISIDKSDTDSVENFADDYNWPFGNKIVRKHKQNLGLREHIMSQGQAFDYYDALIILEDDIIVSPVFYIFTKQAVNFYHDNDNIAGISLYSFALNPYNNYPFEPIKNGYDIYLIQTAQSWGQVWMKNQWREFYKWYNENLDFLPSDNVPSVLFGWKRSWLKYHTRFCIETGRYFVYPYFAFSSDCSDTGIHSKTNYHQFETSMQMSVVRNFVFPERFVDAIKYDAFFENLDCLKYLNLNNNDLCLNLNRLRTGNKRYLLTTQHLNYRVLKSFGLSRHPIEMNVIQNVPGSAIFLYDTSIVETNSNKKNDYELLKYRFRFITILSIIKRIGIKNILKELYNKVNNIIK